jgi:arsenate reductase
VTSDRGRRAVAEFVATAFLLIAVVGSGIMAERLSTDAGLQLLQNALATAGALAALIVAFGPVSGAHMNPAVTLTELALRTTDVLTASAYVAAQITGGFTGVVIANVMFDAPAVEWSTRDRSSTNLLIAEVVATIGLLLVIFLTVRRGHTASIPYAVAAYIGAAYYFTSSTSFANPAVTIARTASDTFAGIAPGSAPLFVAAQLVAVGVTVPLVRLLTPAGRTIESFAESP